MAGVFTALATFALQFTEGAPLPWVWVIPLACFSPITGYFVGHYGELKKTIETQEARLYQTGKLAALGEMASGIAHEINNPLALIHMKAGYLMDVAQEGPIPKETLENALGRIAVTSDHISHILRGLQRISFPGERPMETFCLANVFRDVSILCHEKFKNHGIRLEIEPLDWEPMVKGDSVQIGQVILNLLNNSFYASKDRPSKDRWVKIQVEDRENWIIVSVTDNGEGIPKAMQSRIMDPFFTTKPHGQGTGLGLPISKSILKKHGGRIVYIPEAEGTRFDIYLPSAEVPSNMNLEDDFQISA